MARRKVAAIIKATESENRKIDRDCERILKALASRRTHADFVVLGTEWIKPRLHKQVQALRRVQKRNSRLVNRLKPIQQRRDTAQVEVRQFFQSVTAAIRNVNETNLYATIYS